MYNYICIHRSAQINFQNYLFASKFQHKLNLYKLRNIMLCISKDKKLIKNRQTSTLIISLIIMKESSNCSFLYERWFEVYIQCFWKITSDSVKFTLKTNWFASKSSFYIRLTLQPLMTWLVWLSNKLRLQVTRWMISSRKWEALAYLIRARTRSYSAK